MRLTRKVKRQACTQRSILLVATAFCVGAILLIHLYNPNTALLLGETEQWKSLERITNSKQSKNSIQIWRSQTSACQEIIFQNPTSRNYQTRDPKLATRHCDHVILDFGANIGDTLGKFIDAGLPSCGKKEELVFDTSQKKFLPGRRNALVKAFAGLIQEHDKGLGPEDYCYYGVEGNPVFTSRLQELEDYVMGITPHPISHVHFFTESVGAGADGPTKLYLDTVNSAQNFWGSSILASHQDVRKSAESNSSVHAADVMGYTIGTLMRQTLTAFETSGTATTKNHFILKVDIEGGEYPLLTQAAEEGTLCEFVSKGHTADLLIEFHSQRVTGPNPLFKKKREVVEKLSKCGVTFRNLGANWH